MTATPSRSLLLLRSVDHFARWFAEAVQHAIGSLHDQDALAPPLIGVQPYSDRPLRKR